MFSLGATYLLYNFVLILCPLLCYLAETKGRRSNIIIAYVILFVVSSLRYDIGFDYESYYRSFTNMANNFTYNNAFSISDFNDLEPIPFVLAYIFQWCKHAALCIFASYSFLTIYFLYKTFEYYKIHIIGLFIYIISWILFQSWDWVRQALALSLFLYSIKYIETKSFWKYFLCIFIACLSHYSALILLAVYPLSKLSLNKNIIMVVLGALLIISFTGILDPIKSFIFTLIPYYAQTYAGTEYETVAANHTSISTILSICMYLLYIFIIDEDHKYLLVPFAFGCLLYIISAANLNINRLAWYFTSLQMIIVPLAFKQLRPRTFKHTIVVLSFALQFLIFNYFYIGFSVRGCTPYQTIFSRECEYNEFRDRDQIIWVR